MKIEFDIESREYNNKWYTDIKAWKIEVASSVAQKTPFLMNEKNIDFEIDTDEILPF